MAAAEVERRRRWVRMPLRACLCVITIAGLNVITIDGASLAADDSDRGKGRGRDSSVSPGLSGVEVWELGGRASAAGPAVVR